MNRASNRRAAVVVWPVVAVLLLVWLVGTVIANSVQSSHYHAALRHANASTHFYQVIAKQTEPDTSVVDRLALDLRTVPAAKLRLFRGNSNSYGSVSSTLGFDPFDESCGVECGPLTPNALAEISRAKQGVVPHTTVAHPGGGVGAPLDVLALWVLLGGIFFVWPYFGNMRSHKAMEQRYPDDWRAVAELTKALDSGNLSSTDEHEIRQLRDGLSSALQERMTPGGGGNAVTVSRVASLKSEARDRLAAIEEGNRVLEN